jgi:hypothetical protein
MIESDHVNPGHKCRLDACANLWLYVLMDKVCAHTRMYVLHDEKKRCADNAGRLWQYMQQPWLDESLIHWVAANVTRMYVCMYIPRVCFSVYVCICLYCQQDGLFVIDIRAHQATSRLFSTQHACAVGAAYSMLGSTRARVPVGS